MNIPGIKEDIRISRLSGNRPFVRVTGTLPTILFKWQIFFVKQFRELAAGIGREFLIIIRFPAVRVITYTFYDDRDRPRH